VKWESGGIATYHFDRMNIPRDIVAGQPNPDNWVSSISLPPSCWCRSFI
jgi:hypothetical protein